MRIEDAGTAGRLLHECPLCASPLVQPVGWKERSSDLIELTLRCPECFARTAGEYSAQQVRALDFELCDARESLEQLHQALVEENMRELLEALTQAMERELIYADDFAPRSSG